MTLLLGVMVGLVVGVMIGVAAAVAVALRPWRWRYGAIYRGMRKDVGLGRVASGWAALRFPHRIFTIGPEDE